MASLQQITKGWQTGYRLRYSRHRKQHSAWLGPVRESEATAFLRHVEAIEEALRLGTPIPTVTQRWLQSLPAKMRRALDPLIGTEKTVDEAAEGYIAHCQATLKTTSARGNADSINQFASYFGSTPLRSINGEVIDTWLARQNVSAGTVGKHVKNFRAWFKWCLQHQFVDAIPTIQTSATIGRGEKQYIDFDMYQQVIDYFAGEPEVQLAVALPRWFGLRVASELCPLLRSSVDLANTRLVIEDTKRTHRQSRGPPIVRRLPLFSGIRPYLMPMLDRPGNPNDYLLPTYGGQDPERIGSLLRQRAYRAVAALGLPPWPRIFHSVRATRQTQLKDRFGEKAACDWIGNTPEVYRSNYELLPDEILDQAVDW